MKQINIKRVIKLKIISITIITTMISSCASKNSHKEYALKIIENNNAILQEIKRDRIKLKKGGIQQDKRDLKQNEKRLIMALNSVIKANESLKKEFIKNQTTKEKENDRR